MNRRDFLQAAALLVAGTSMVPKGWAMNHEQSRFLAAQPDYINRHTLTFFTGLQRAAVAAAAEQVIPATDTPGAIDAGVPRFIELMVSDWFNDDERTDFMTGLDLLQAAAGGDFASLPADEQLSLLENLEDEASDSSWYDIGNVMRIWMSDAPFICQFKELTILGYFLSEPGATQATRENPMGSFKGDIPLAKDDTSYAVELPFRMILD